MSLKEQMLLGIVISGIVAVALILLIIFPELRAKVDYKGTTYVLPYHIFDGKAKEIRQDESRDIIELRASDLIKIENLNEVYLPGIGKVDVIRYTEDYIIIDALKVASDGMSGMRVLTPDLLFDIGFISRIENGEVIVVRTLDF